MSGAENDLFSFGLVHVYKHPDSRSLVAPAVCPNRGSNSIFFWPMDSPNSQYLMFLLFTTTDSLVLLAAGAALL